MVLMVEPVVRLKSTMIAVVRMLQMRSIIFFGLSWVVGLVF